MSRNLHETERYVEPLPDEVSREPFNDVMAHGDVVAGYQTAKHSGQVPRLYRLYATISVLFFVGTMLWEVVKFFRDL